MQRHAGRSRVNISFRNAGWQETRKRVCEVKRSEMASPGILPSSFRTWEAVRNSVGSIGRSENDVPWDARPRHRSAAREKRAENFATRTGHARRETVRKKSPAIWGWPTPSRPHPAAARQGILPVRRPCPRRLPVGCICDIHTWSVRVAEDEIQLVGIELRSVTAAIPPAVNQLHSPDPVEWVAAARSEPPDSPDGRSPVKLEAPAQEDDQATRTDSQDPGSADEPTGRMARLPDEARSHHRDDQPDERTQHREEADRSDHQELLIHPTKGMADARGRGYAEGRRVGDHGLRLWSINLVRHSPCPCIVTGHPSRGSSQ